MLDFLREQALSKTPQSGGSLVASNKKMQLKIRNNIELKNALNIIWMISALIFLLVFISIILYPENLILANIPICENQKKGSECFLCGSSRAFIEIKKLNFSNAYNYNKGSILLFIIMTINFLTYLYNNQFNIKIFKSKL
ncbi:hypothetical protein FPG87_12660 [Flavobacterium psychrophilum]|nr:hypothetical protein FPG87_12660 [Flavobacterium psychrophilum]OUD24374.1 hypothetical protein FPG92_12670 [Flavobacterium psychrophilum]